MIALDLQSAYFSQEEMEANIDPMPYPEREEWEVTLSKMKEAILDRNILKTRLLIYSLEREVTEAKFVAYQNGFQHGMKPLPF